MQRVTRTWTIGGIGLIACGSIGMLRASLLTAPVSDYLSVAGSLIYAASIIVLAVGLTRQASIVARRPLGVAALVLVATWPLLANLTAASLLLAEPQGYGNAWTIFSSLSLIVPGAAGLIAASQIARAGVVPYPWSWVPLWVLGFQALTVIAPQVAVVSADAGEVQTLANLFAVLGMASFLAGTLGLGILAVVLAARQRPESVVVYRSA